MNDPLDDPIDDVAKDLDARDPYEHEEELEIEEEENFLDPR
jgi:hypothetical protein